MPLKVSAQGWVKVAPPPRPRRRRIDPEEQKQALCSPLRYFACQNVDTGGGRLGMLGREGFSSSQVDLIRPHSRLERSSTLDEWRWDTHQSRSSSRMSGDLMEGSSPPKHSENNAFDTGDRHTGRVRSNSDRSRGGQGMEGRSSRTSGGEGGSKPSREKDRQRVSSAPVIIPVSPESSIYDDAESHAEDIVQVEVYPDHVSVAYTETPSERHCRHSHRHRRDRKPPTVIPEEDEPEIPSKSIHTSSDICSRRHTDDDVLSSVSTSAPSPTIPRSRRTDVNIPSPIPEAECTANTTPKSASARSERSPRSERLEKTEHSAQSENSSRSSYLSHSSSYRSRRAESESSYTASERSASPIRDEHRARTHRHRSKDNDTESYYPSPPPSPHLSARKSRYEPRSSEMGSRIQRDRVATAPASTSHSKYQPASSTSSWTSGSTRSSAPSINGYQLQAAIFQPKNYRGYRAPSLSKGNRWETATSALSFD